MQDRVSVIRLTNCRLCKAPIELSIRDTVGHADSITISQFDAATGGQRLEELVAYDPSTRRVSNKISRDDI